MVEEEDGGGGHLRAPRILCRRRREVGGCAREFQTEEMAF